MTRVDDDEEDRVRGPGDRNTSPPVSLLIVLGFSGAAPLESPKPIRSLSDRLELLVDMLETVSYTHLTLPTNREV